MNEVTLIGNEGFWVRAASAHIYVDAFYYSIPDVAAHPAVKGRSVRNADLILVTHAHPDHFRAVELAGVAVRTGATVVGPADALRRLEGRVPAAQLKEMDPPRARGAEAAHCLRLTLPCAAVTAFATLHGRRHNSYLVETPSFRFFHDGDNEDTRRIPAAALGRLDALLIGPWQGSGWVEFVEKVAPARWFLMHLSESELEEHAAGRFLPGICDRVPDGLVVLRPGETFVFPRASRRSKERESPT